MSTSERSEADRRKDAELAALFEQVGTRPEPSAEQLDRWRHDFAADLKLVRKRRRRRTMVWLAGACAAAIAVAVAMNWSAAPVPSPVPVAEVVTAFGGNVVIADGTVGRALNVGDVLLEGERVQSGQRSGLGLLCRGADVRLDAGTVAVFREDRLELVSGAVYLDTGPAPTTETWLIDTPVGTFSHLGTQFLVRVVDGEVMGAVREGTIRLRSDHSDIRLAATSETARAVVVDATGSVRRTDVEAGGELWSWALQSAPGMVLNSRSADEVLRWAAREQGLRLEYASEAVERSARRAILSAGPEPAPPARALDVVNAATRLELDTSRGNVLQVTRPLERDEQTY